MEAKYYRPITKTLFFAALGLLLFMTSCKKEHDGVLRADMASFSVNNNQKAYIDAQRYNCFEIGEKVRVNNSTGNVAALERNDRQCDISGVPSATNYYAFYPSVLLSNQSEDLSSGVNGKGVTLPRVQEYKYVNGHQSIQNPMAAELLNADENNYTLHFHNLCALLKVNIHTRSAFDSIKIQIKYNQDIYLSGAGTIDFNNQKIVMNTSGSNLYTDVTLALPQGHTGKPGGESFYIVVPAFKIANNAHPNDLILEIKNGSKTVKRYVKSLQKDNEILANHIYTLGTFMFDIGLFSVRDGKTVIFAPGNLQWSYTGGGTTPTTHNINGATGYNKGTWRFAEHQYDFIGSDNVNAHGRDVTGNDYGARVYSNIFDENYTGWIDFFSWGGSGYGTTRPYYYNNSTSEKCYCTDNSLSNYDWGTFNTIYNPKTKENDPCGTWYTLSAAEWEYVLTQRGQFWENTDHPWWMFNLVHLVKTPGDTINGLILYPDTTLDCPIQSIKTKWMPRNNFTEQYTITQAEYDTLEAFGCVFLPSAGRMAYGLDANAPMQIHDPNAHGGYWASDAGTIAPHWVYVNEGAFGLHGDAGGGVSLNTALMSVRLAHVVKDNSSSSSD